MRLVKVYLIGGGPGDPYLLTLKAKEVLAQSDVVLYDNLVSSEVMFFIARSAKNVFVGKQAGKASYSQKDINQILLREYRDLKKLDSKRRGIIVRLKGGDPFVFGRATEEISILAANNIPFEVIPGISSFHGGLVSAGIPFTDRDHSSSFAVVTGHYKKSSENKEIQTSNADTTIYMMGMLHLVFIVAANLKNGKNLQTPVAIIENASRLEQRVVTGTLATIEHQAKQYNLKPPAIIVVGKVVSLRNLCDWWSNRPLLGKTVLLVSGNDFLKKSFEMEGARVIKTKAFTAEFTDYPVNKLEKFLTKQHILFFSSPGAVKKTILWLRKKALDIRAFKHSIISCYGQRTERELNKHHLSVDKTYSQLLKEREGTNNVPLLFAGHEGHVLKPFFKQERCHIIPLYRLKKNDLSFALDKADIIALFSPLSVHHLSAQLKEYHDKEIICYGKQTKDALLAQHMSPSFFFPATSFHDFFGAYMHLITKNQ